MRKLRTPSVRRILIGVVLCLFLIYPMHLALNHYPLDTSILEKIKPNFSFSSDKSGGLYYENAGDSELLQTHLSSPILIFPNGFQDEAMYKAKHIIDGKKVVTYDGNSTTGTLEIVKLDKKKHSLQIFTNPLSNQKTCSELEVNKELITSHDRVFDEDFKNMVETLIRQLKNEDALKDLAGFFEGKLPQMVKEGSVRKHFYKFAGTSVWMPEHGVHLMVSRVLFSRRGIKWNPQISLLYAQVFDENWQEMTNVELVVNTMTPEGKREYQNLKFPQFLPIPFYHNSDFTKRRWYGPEDTRIMMVQNEMGKQEPIIIFNSDQRNYKEQKFVKDLAQLKPDQKEEELPNDITMQVSYEMHRSIFVGWPFRYQLGKTNTDGIADERFDNVKYNKVAELRINGEARKKIEKNWTPFVDPMERTSDGDNHLYIIYKWDNLEVLKCQLVLKDNDLGKCDFVYKDPSEAKDNAKIGPVRGGTEIISLSTIDAKNPQYQRTWVGFLRAHINHCGCGRSMYRPNFYILRRDPDSSTFNVIYLSSSIAFDIPVVGWRKHEVQCAKRDPNVLIPNGISSWQMDTERDVDVLSLTLSVADEDNRLLHIYGIKELIDELLANYENMASNSGESNVNLGNEILMDCAVEASKQFCKAYGNEQTRLGTTEEVLLAKTEKNSNDQDEKKKQEEEKERKKKLEEEANKKEEEEKKKTMMMMKSGEAGAKEQQDQVNNDVKNSHVDPSKDADKDDVVAEEHLNG